MRYDNRKPRCSNQFDDPHFVLFIETGKRLVEQYDVVGERKCTCQRYALLLTSGQFTGFQNHLFFHIQFTQDSFRFFLIGNNRNIFERRQMVQKARLLKYDRNRTIQKPVDLSAVRFLQSAQNAQQCCFADPGFSGNHHDALIGNGNGIVGEHLFFAKLYGQVFDFNHISAPLSSTTVEMHFPV